MDIKTLQILLIEDHPMDGQLIQEYLTRAERAVFIITWVKNLAEGRKAFTQRPPDILLLDLSLPDSQGLETLRQVDPVSLPFPVVVLTGFEDEHTALKTVEFGAQDYLTKQTFSTLVLERTILYAIERKKITHQLEQAKEEVEHFNRHLIEFNQKTAWELEQARITQLAIMPPVQINHGGLRITAKYKPAEQIGGDFYDVFELSETKTAIVIADVAGHGVPAALLSFMVFGLFKMLTPHHITPSSVMAALNNALFEKMEKNKFATAFYLLYDASTQILHFATAGHPAAYLLQKSTGKLIPFRTNGPLLGVFPAQNSSFEEGTLLLKNGDKILLYTDGIVEAAKDVPESSTPKITFGIPRLEQQLKESFHLPFNELLDTLYDVVLTYSERTTLEDDLTLVGFEVMPS